VLDHILEHDQCDVDLQNKLQRDTPLHLAVKIEENGREGLREYLGELQIRMPWWYELSRWSWSEQERVGRIYWEAARLTR
jgi:hypothetical protein